MKPRPPQLRTQAFACHLVLEQAPEPQRVAGVVSILFGGPDRDAFQQYAASFPKFVNKPLVIEGATLQPHSDLRRCTLTAGDAPTRLSSGYNIGIRIASVHSTWR